MTERVTLVLGENRIEVLREDLISKSEYFASLFSPHFRDSLNAEHRINYDIDAKTLRTFVSWVSDPVASVAGDLRHVKPSLAKYVGDSADFDDLLELLQTSVLFAADALIGDLTNLIACHWLIPEKSVQIWLLAKELGLSILRDLAKVACIDRLADLPVASLLELPGEDFINLVGNVHVDVSRRFLIDLTKQWIKRNVPTGETNKFATRYPFTLINENIRWWNLEKKYREQQREHNIQCIVGHKRTESNKDKLCIYCWDGTTFSEILELPSFATVSTNSLIGMQAVGRGCDIYVVGGEYGTSTGHFQKEIWRYSMISKTWYFVTSMPRPRRHMAVVFVKEKLFLIGGRQSNNCNRSTVDVYNLHTGKWNSIPPTYEQYTSTSLKYSDHDTLTLYDNRLVYCWDEEENRWSSYCGDFNGVVNDADGEFLNMEYITARFIWSLGQSLYVLGQQHNRKNYNRNLNVRNELGPCNHFVKPKVWNLEDYEHFESNFVGDCLTTFDNQVANGPYVIGFSYEDDTMCVEEIKITSCDTMETRIVYKEARSDIQDLCLQDPIGCFNVFDLRKLNELFSPKDDAK